MRFHPFTQVCLNGITILCIAVGTVQAHRQQVVDLTDICPTPPGLRVIDVMIPRLGPMKIAIRDGGDIVSRVIEQSGYWEIKHPQDLAALADQELPGSGTMLDIGAHIGWYSLIFAKFGYNVIAVEPMPTNQKALETSLCLNPDLRDRVQIARFGLGNAADTNRTCVITAMDSENLGDGSLRCSLEPHQLPCNPATASSDCSQVAVKTLDVALAELAPNSIDVVKMDVEDAECKVLEGGQSLFSTYKARFIQAETIAKPVAECFSKEAAKHGYTLGVHHGHDQNRVMTPTSFLQGDVDFGRDGEEDARHETSKRAFQNQTGFQRFVLMTATAANEAALHQQK